MTLKVINLTKKNGWAHCVSPKRFKILNKTDKKRRTNRGGYTEIEKVNRGGYIKLTVAVTILGKYQKGLLLTLKTNTLRFGIKNH